MKYDPRKHHRHSIRLKGYDYTQPGAYFITVVTHQREALFGEIINGAVRLNDFGYLVMNEWRRLGKRFPNVVVDEFVVMPNHIHGILFLRDNQSTSPVVGTGPENSALPGGPSLAPPQHRAPSYDPTGGPGQENSALPGGPSLAPPQHPAPQRNPPGLDPASLGAVIGAYKSTTARLINGLRHTRGLPVWQRNYYEHIVRAGGDYARIVEYIRTNPLRWKADQLHPAAPPNAFNQE